MQQVGPRLFLRADQRKGANRDTIAKQKFICEDETNKRTNNFIHAGHFWIILFSLSSNVVPPFGWFWFFFWGGGWEEGESRTVYSLLFSFHSPFVSCSLYVFLLGPLLSSQGYFLFFFLFHSTRRGVFWWVDGCHSLIHEVLVVHDEIISTPSLITHSLPTLSICSFDQSFHFPLSNFLSPTFPSISPTL